MTSKLLLFARTKYRKYNAGILKQKRHHCHGHFKRGKKAFRMDQKHFFFKKSRFPCEKIFHIGHWHFIRFIRWFCRLSSHSRKQGASLHISAYNVRYLVAVALMVCFCVKICVSDKDWVTLLIIHNATEAPLQTVTHCAALEKCFERDWSTKLTRT